MKTKVLSLLILSFFFFSPLNLCKAEIAPNAGPYFEVKKDLDITLYYRWVQVSETVKTRQVKAVFSCKADPEDVITLLRDDRSFLSWMKSTTSYYRIKTTDNRNWYCYVRYGFPWPLKDMDCILMYRIEDLKGASGFRVVITGLPDYISSMDGVNRISHLECEWTIKVSTTGFITVEYTQFSKVPSKYPRWIVDPIAQKSLINSLNSLRELIEKHHHVKIAEK